MKLNYLISLVLLCITSFAYSQEGTVRGFVFDPAGNPVEHVLVKVKETSFRTQTNSAGEYIIPALAYGSYTIEVSTDQSVMLQKTIELNSSELYVPAFKFDPGTTELESLVIYGQRKNKFATENHTAVSKMPLSYMETPQVYSTINKNLMEEQITTDISDVIKNIPGVVKMQGSPGRAGDGSYSYNLRGFPTRISLVDGIPANTNGEIDVADIESIEIIKGPAGTLYGGAVTSYGGVINVVTKKPKELFGGTAGYVFGSYNLNRISADIYGPLAKSEKLSFRINTAYQNQNSFRNSEFKKSFFFSPSLNYQVSDRLTFNFGAQVYNYEGTNTPIVFLSRTRPFFARTPDELRFDWNDSYTNSDITLKAPSVNIKAQAHYVINSSWTSQTHVSRNTRKTDGIYQYQFIRGNDSDELLERNFQIQHSEATSTSIQQNFNGSFSLGKVKNKVLIGLDFLNQTLENNHSPIVKYDTINGVNRNQKDGRVSRELVLDAINKKSTNLLRNYTSTTIYSLYVADVINFTEDFSTLVSMRVDHFKNNGETNLNTKVVSGDFSQTLVSPKFGLVYQLWKKQLSVFANYMNGFTYVAPVTQELPEYSGNLKPQKANQTEIGMKTQLFDGRLNFTASYYTILVNNMSRSIDVEKEGESYNIVVQDGEQRSKGVELELIANPFEGFNIVMGYSYNDSKYEKSSPDILGRRPSSSGPAQTFNAWMSYTLQNTRLKGLGAGLGVNYVGDQITVDNATTGQFVFPSYTLVNATVFYENTNYRLGFKVNNILNENYFTGQGVIVAQMPRNFSAEVLFKF